MGIFNFGDEVNESISNGLIYYTGSFMKEMDIMFYYKGAFRETDNVIYFKSDVSLAQNDVVLFGEKKYFIESVEKEFLLLQRVGSIVSVSL
ncbi:hypothetical protein MHI12_21765 [Paenibacillus sp. FSL H8-0280]|uniref:hypothetical protein n=1 Tax=Paenibacillus sp. FSL H8-0280 TaxID=2921382 RepID=UPI003252656C